MDKTRVVTSLVIGIAVIVIIFAFTPLRWVIVDGLNSSDDSASAIAGTTVVDGNQPASTGDTDDISTLIDDIEALIDVIEVPVDEVTEVPTNEIIEEPTDETIEPVISTKGQSPDARSTVLAFIEQWRQARLKADIDTYLSFYSSEFTTSDQTSIDVWQAGKRRQFGSQADLIIRFADIGVQVDQASNSATVTFEQEVRANEFYDWSNQKLALVFEDDQWRIVSESAID